MPQVIKVIGIEAKHDEFLKESGMNLSAFVRKKLNEVMGEKDESL